jgi:hypothetical protein
VAVTVGGSGLGQPETFGRSAILTSPSWPVNVRAYGQAKWSGDTAHSSRRRPIRKDGVELNDAILEVIALVRTEDAKNSASVCRQVSGRRADGVFSPTFGKPARCYERD